MHRIIFLVILFLLMRLGLGLSGLKLKATFPRHAAQASRSPSTPIEESCAHTRIDTEEGNITHVLNSTPRAWTFVRWYRSSLASRVLKRGSLLLGLASKLWLLLLIYNASCQLSVFELAANPRIDRLQCHFDCQRIQENTAQNIQGCQESARTLATQARPRSAANTTFAKHSFKK
jgi:hypothetical protein